MHIIYAHVHTLYMYKSQKSEKNIHRMWYIFFIYMVKEYIPHVVCGSVGLNLHSSDFALPFGRKLALPLWVPPMIMYSNWPL